MIKIGIIEGGYRSKITSPFNKSINHPLIKKKIL
jgi:hypothetical protein